MLDSAPGPGLTTSGDAARVAGLLAFRRLDLLLAAGVAAARQRYGAEAAGDSFRGLYLNEEQIERGLLTPAGEPLVAGEPEPDAPGWALIAAGNPGWAWLAERFGLGERELDIVLIALGPDVDRRYEQLYGYLQNDVSARRPGVNLALDLLTRSPAERIAAMADLGADRPLVAHRLLTLRTDPRVPDPPLIARHLAVDEQITSALLGRRGLDHRLDGWCRLVTPGRGSADSRLPALIALTEEAWGRRLCFHGPVGSGRRRTALELGRRLGRPVLLIAGAELATDPPTVPDRLRLGLRQAELDGALTYLEDADALFGSSDRIGPPPLIPAIAAHPGVVVLGTAQAWTPSAHVPLGVIDVPFEAPAAPERRRLWRREVRETGAGAASRDLAAVSDRFRLSGAQIRDAARSAAGAAQLVRPPGTEVRLARRELFTAARRQTGRELADYARLVRLVHGWDDLVLPEDPHRQLRELAARVEHRTQVMDEWGFDATLATGRGVSALFSGPPGTGKTMAAAVIAAELGLDLFAIDLSTVVSKYIGETEKSLARVFRAAADSGAILFFDEADALFGKRSEVRDAHDRYANVEIAYLLQRMEEYEGLAVLATNLRHHIDEAFIRRLHVIVDFPFPDVPERQRIWRACLPGSVPLADDVDLAAMARYRLAGGNIRNAVLGAAYLAAEAGTAVGQAELIAAVRREHQKMGRTLPGAGP